MLSYIKILRPLNCLMSAIAVLIGGFLVLKGFAAAIGMAMLAVFLITGAGNVINDYVDIEADRINRPKRPIPSGKISPKAALAYSIILFAAGIILSGFINWIVFVIALVNSLLLIVYSTHLQNKVLAGNGCVAYLVGSAFLFGGAAAGNLILPLLLMLLAGLSNFSREVVKDLEDIEGDKLSFIKRIGRKVKEDVIDRFSKNGGGIELKFKEKHAIITAVAALILTIAVSPLPYLLNILGLSYLLVLIPTDIAFIASAAIIAGKKSRKKYSLASKAIKLGMLLGLIAFIVGILA